MEPELTDEEFAARMRGARAYMDLTLVEAGKLLGLSQQGLSRRESGQQKIPAAERFYFSAIYLRETDLPERWFTERRISRILEPLEDDDEADLSPAEVVELVEDQSGDDVGADGPS